MSSAATLSWDDGAGVSGNDWARFCTKHGITHSPSTMGGNVFYAGDVEFHFGKADFDSKTAPDYAEEIAVATYHFGKSTPEVARLARELWLTHGGRLSADPEIRRLLVGDERPTKSGMSRIMDSIIAKNEMKVLATIEFPGSVYLMHGDAQGLPAQITDQRTPWVRGPVPGGELIVLGVPIGIVHEVRPESERQHEMGSDSPAEWVTYRTAVVLNLDLGALLTR